MHESLVDSRCELHQGSEQQESILPIHLPTTKPARLGGLTNARGTKPVATSPAALAKARKMMQQWDNSYLNSTVAGDSNKAADGDTERSEPTTPLFSKHSHSLFNNQQQQNHQRQHNGNGADNDDESVLEVGTPAALPLKRPLFNASDNDQHHDQHQAKRQCVAQHDVLDSDNDASGCGNQEAATAVVAQDASSNDMTTLEAEMSCTPPSQPVLPFACPTTPVSCTPPPARTPTISPVTCTPPVPIPRNKVATLFATPMCGCACLADLWQPLATIHYAGTARFASDQSVAHV
jgi:hypothetical protein